MKKKILVCLIVILLIGLLLVGAADARSGDNLNEIKSGDLVFIGEKGLDVSTVAFGEYSQMFCTREPGDMQYTIKISNGKIDVEEKSGVTYPLTYYPYNVSNNEYDMTNSIIVTDLESVLDGIYVKKGTADEIAANGATIINTDKLKYVIKVKGAYNTEFNNFITDAGAVSQNWFSFGFEPDSAGYRKEKVTDESGAENVPILGTDPTKLDNAAKFTYSANGMKSGSHSVKLSFILNLPTIPASDDSKKPQITATHAVRESSPEDFSITADKTTVDPGDSPLTLTLKGNPLAVYDLTISPAESSLTFEDGILPSYGTVKYIDEHSLRVTFGEDADKTIAYPVNVDENAKSGEYYIYMSDEKNNRKSLLITINKIDRVPTIEISADAKNGKFVSGDTIRIDVTYDNPKKGEKADLILKPQNCAERILRSELTFENGKDARLPYLLQTRGLDAGTYELIIRTSEGTEGKTAFYLGTPTIIASISGGYNSVLVTGEELKLEWYARGSPYIQRESDTLGTVRWYILGTNFAQAGNKTFEITGGTVGESAPEGHSTYTYGEEFTEGLSEGRYNIIIEHPGADNIFAFEPDTYFAPLNTITTAWGETISISSMQTANAATMLMEQLNGVKSDDLAVMLTFDVEKPWITLTDISPIKLGGQVTISGETNYPADKTVSLTIYPASFTPSEAQNTAMSMTAYAEEKTKDSGDYNKRTFNIPIPGADTWYPGTYVGYFALPDKGIVRSVSFIVGTDGDITSPDITIDTVLPDAYDYTGTVPTPEPAALTQPIAQPTALPISTTPAPQSCIPILGMVSAFAAAAVILRRMP